MKLTHKRVVTRTGFANYPYITTASKDKLTQRLGKIEHEALPLFSKICDEICDVRKTTTTQDEFEEHCKSCCMNRIMRILEGKME